MIDEKEQQKVRRIQDDYAVERKAYNRRFWFWVIFICGLVFEFVAFSILGAGVCMSIGLFGENTVVLRVFGIIIGVLGLVLILVNFFVFSTVLRKKNKK